MANVRLSLVILAVSDLARALTFYRAAFGWEQTVGAPVYVEFTLPGGQRVGLYERHAFGKNMHEVPVLIPRGTLAPTELYCYADDLPSAIERLESAGARLLSLLTPRSWGDEVAYFADPDGNVIALARPLPERPSA
jgi:catechol 2,3-dioxygenase-like lactoylglutathione lyase family enzyme